MENKLNRLINEELMKRAISAIVFVPLMILPLFYSDYLLVLVYLICNTIILVELNMMSNNKKTSTLNLIFSLITIYSFFFFIFISIINDYLKLFLIEILITIWIFDTFSYLGGKLIRGKKLFPKISTGKTYSGLFSGLICTMFILQIYKYILEEMSVLSIFITLGIILAAFLGDLVASLLKRTANIKDSGGIMPGHGGLFDRLDSFIGVIFLFSMLYLII